MFLFFSSWFYYVNVDKEIFNLTESKFKAV